MSNFEERVSRGIALLNEKRPQWKESINMEKLDLQSCYRCIIGQLFGCYTESALRSLGTNIDSCWHYGFSLKRSELYGMYVGKSFAELTNEWIKQIQAPTLASFSENNQEKILQALTKLTSEEIKLLGLSRFSS